MNRRGRVRAGNIGIGRAGNPFPVLSINDGPRKSAGDHVPVSEMSSWGRYMDESMDERNRPG